MKWFSSFGIKVLLLLTTGLVSIHSSAAETYNDYMADLYLLQSYQARSPSRTISYTDEKNGALARSVLSPERFKPQFEFYFKSVARSKDKGMANLMQVAQPMLERYEAAFKAEPKRYESEYLDSLEFSCLAMTGSSRILSNSAPQKGDPNLKPEEQKQMTEMAEKLRNSMRGLSETMARGLADTLRKRASSGEFSAEGSKRVLALADSLAPQPK